MAVALEAFVKQLTDSGIVAPGKLENFIPPKAHPKDAQELARELVASKELTKFQAQECCAGRARSLILGNYTLLDRIGAGGMGQVFKAEHRRMHRLVAIKMLPAALTNDAAVLARFEREVTAAAKLRHPNVVAADDADEAGGVHFLVMEYVEGQDLSAFVKKNGPFSVAKAIHYILQAARGLEFAHGEGVVHRDIKPANLLLDKKGTVKILDMGLARLDHPGGDAATQAELTGSGAVMGTVDYMAPEQALNTKHADHRADIYSLGITLYYLIAGKCAYDGETVMEKLMAHQTKPIPSLKDIQASVPESVQIIFTKMVAKKKEDRYQSMTEVIEALERCEGGLSSSSASATVKTSSSPDTQESEMTAAFDSRLLKSIPQPEAFQEPVSKGPPRKKVKLLAGAGAAGFLLLLLGLVVIFTKQKGEEVGRRELPEGTSVEVQALAKADPAKAVSGQSNQRPPLSHAVASSVPEIGALPKPLVAPFDAKHAAAGQAAWAKHLGTKIETINSVEMRMTLIPPGEFLMGSTDEQVAAALQVAAESKADQGIKDRIQKAERPKHSVVVARPFLLGATEVTIGQFKQFVDVSKYATEAEQYGFSESADKKLVDKITPDQKQRNWRTPGYAVGDDSPVTQVTWNDAAMFCNWLSAQEGLPPCYRRDGDTWAVATEATGYRLPTEAEWEYACRAGTTTQYFFGDDYRELAGYGWYNQNAGGRARATGLKPANPFGLYDMHGNAAEWCQDCYDETWYGKSPLNDPKGPTAGFSRLIRGGFWTHPAYQCRSAYRFDHAPSYRYRSLGFRIARVLDGMSINRAVATTATPSASPAMPTKRWETPEFQAWVKATQSLPAEQQIEAVSQKLMELNPGFDGALTGVRWAATPKIENGVVTEIGFSTGGVADISPVRALAGLKYLACKGPGGLKGKLADLSPLAGMQLRNLECGHNPIRDLSPLRGLGLEKLDCGGMEGTDLRPLAGMPLTELSLYSTPVSDLWPLAGMKLTFLNCVGAPVSDLTPLAGMPLVNVQCPSTKVANPAPLATCKQLANINFQNCPVTPAAIAALQKALPDCKIEWDDPAKQPSPQPARPGSPQASPLSP